jgi:ectoine hydroxylase-related dioxygenase (phytanoyl-CoA dioxygenase family)
MSTHRRYLRRRTNEVAAYRWAVDIQHIKASEPAELIAEALEADGAVIVEELLAPDLLARFNAELDPLLADAAEGDDRRFLNDVAGWFFGAQTRHVTGIAGRSRVFATEILTHPVYRTVCDAVLLPNCARYQLNIAHVLDRGPGSDQQLLHRDELVWVHLPQPHPEVQLASVVALVDFTADNGATRVAPGSHKWERDRWANDDELVPAEMPAGAAVIYLGSTIHGGGANVTDERRRGMHVSYCAGWLRTEENQYLATPLDVARTLPREAQELLGYAVHDALAVGGGYLGAVEVQDPIELIAAGQL